MSINKICVKTLFLFFISFAHHLAADELPGVASPLITDPLPLDASPSEISAPVFTSRDLIPILLTPSDLLNFSFTVVATGNPTPSLFHGVLPEFVSFEDHNDGTGILSGKVSRDVGPIELMAKNDVGSVKQTCSFVFCTAETPKFTSAASTTFKVGTESSFTVVATGFPAPALFIEIPDKLPEGVDFSDKGDGRATISGTPGAGTEGDYPLILMAINITRDSLSGGIDTQKLLLTIAPPELSPPRFTSGHVVPALVSHFKVCHISFKVSAIGYPIPSLSHSVLPESLNFEDHNNGTGTLWGTMDKQFYLTIEFTAKNDLGLVTQTCTFSFVEDE